jgi:hypothetical protein
MAVNIVERGACVRREIMVLHGWRRGGR